MTVWESIRKWVHMQLVSTWSQLSWLTEPLRTDSGLKNGISVHELISTLKIKKIKKRKKKEGRKKEKNNNVQAGNKSSNISSKSLHTRKKPPPPLWQHMHRKIVIRYCIMHWKIVIGYCILQSFAFRCQKHVHILWSLSFDRWSVTALSLSLVLSQSLHSSPNSVLPLSLGASKPVMNQLCCRLRKDYSGCEFLPTLQPSAAGLPFLW